MKIARMVDVDGSFHGLWSAKTDLGTHVPLPLDVTAVSDEAIFAATEAYFSGYTHFTTNMVARLTSHVTRQSMRAAIAALAQVLGGGGMCDFSQRDLHDDGNRRIGQRMSAYFRLDEEHTATPRSGEPEEVVNVRAALARGEVSVSDAVVLHPVLAQLDTVTAEREAACEDAHAQRMRALRAEQESARLREDRARLAACVERVRGMEGQALDDDVYDLSGGWVHAESLRRILAELE